MSSQGPKAQSAPELKAQIEAEREGRPFLVFRDGADAQVILQIPEGTTEFWVGRRESLRIITRPNPRATLRGV